MRDLPGFTLEDVSRETRQRFDIYLRLLRDWQKSINLVAPSTLADAETRHIADSLQLFGLLDGASHIVDMGSGAGFPGLVLAIMLEERGGGAVDLIESSAKKCAFLRTVSRETGLNSAKTRVSVHNQRIDAVTGTISTPQIVTARALASLTDLCSHAAPWLTVGARGLFPKGRDFQGEVSDAGQHWTMRCDIYRSRIEADSVILEITDLAKR